MANRTLEELKTLPLDERSMPRDGHGGGDGRGGDGFRRGDGFGGGGDEAARTLATRVGLWFFLTAISMLFVAFTASYLARRGAADWTAVPMPGVLWLNTGVLLASSLSLEWARRGARRGDMARLRAGLGVTGAAGLLFVAGQVTAWRQLVAAGVFMATNPHSAFFYLLTGVHGVHLVGGIGALAYALLRAWTRPRRAAGAVEGVTTYWHFLDGLWLYVFAVLFFI